MKIVTALGGNALGDTPDEQKINAAKAAVTLADFIQAGHNLVISHGNGPQVGMILNGLNYSAKKGAIRTEIPTCECGAMSQGYIGYHLLGALTSELESRGIEPKVATVVTRVEVSAADQAFINPTKPIGTFYSAEEAKQRMDKEPGSVYKEDAGRGWRLVVPSPKPIDIAEKDSICALLDKGFSVIACGGGGIPVVKNDNGFLEGVDAVIDKDFASAKLAEVMDADLLFILTAVDSVKINFNKYNEEDLRTITSEQAQEYINQGQFAPGSMLPKVQAAMQFVNEGKNRKAVICSLNNANAALKGESGTTITKS